MAEKEKGRMPKYDVAVSLRKSNGTWEDNVARGAVWDKGPKDAYKSEEAFEKAPEFNGKVTMFDHIKYAQVDKEITLKKGDILSVSLFDVARRPATK